MTARFVFDLDAELRKLRGNPANSAKVANPSGTISDISEISRQGVAEADLQEAIREHFEECAAHKEGGILWAETESPEAIQSREARRERMLTMLADNPALHRAYLVEPDAYPSAASVFIADRDKNFEVLIPRKWFDSFAVAELVRSWVLRLEVTEIRSSTEKPTMQKDE